MHRRLAGISSLVLVAILTILSLLGKGHQFQLVEKAKLCGVDLEPGCYQLKSSEDCAGIYKGKRLLVVAKVRTEPMNEETPNSCCCSNGILTEVRMETEKVVFLKLLDRP